MYALRPERAVDHPEVEALLDLCFAPGRTALSSYRLRDGVAPVPGLCLVLRDSFDVMVGAIRFWPVHVADEDVLLLGPVAVHPTAQGEGLGGLLIREGLERADMQGWLRVMLVGDAPYYARFGFAVLPPGQLVLPGPADPARFLALELVEGVLKQRSGAVTSMRFSSDA